jgi:aminoglycoside 3-N-acetyltransferase
VHELGGQVLLLGVGHSANTTLHLDESIAGVPYAVLRPCVVDVPGVPQRIMIPETDHCCRRFELADGWLKAAGLQREGKVGNAHARWFGSRELVTLAVEQLTADPLVFLCPPGDQCPECDEARASIDPVLAGRPSGA